MSMLRLELLRALGMDLGPYLVERTLILGSFEAFTVHNMCYRTFW